MKSIKAFLLFLLHGRAPEPPKNEVFSNGKVYGVITGRK